MRVFMATIKEWAKAKKEKWYDLRNEDTVNTAEKIVEALDEDDVAFRFV